MTMTTTSTANTYLLLRLRYQQNLGITYRIVCRFGWHFYLIMAKTYGGFGPFYSYCVLNSFVLNDLIVLNFVTLVSLLHSTFWTKVQK